MAIRRVRVLIDHTFEMFISDELLDDDRAFELEDLVYEKFENSDWEFDELIVRNLDGSIA